MELANETTPSSVPTLPSRGKTGVLKTICQETEIQTGEWTEGGARAQPGLEPAFPTPRPGLRPMS